MPPLSSLFRLGSMHKLTRNRPEICPRIVLDTPCALSLCSARQSAEALQRNPPPLTRRVISALT